MIKKLKFFTDQIFGIHQFTWKFQTIFFKAVQSGTDSFQFLGMCYPVAFGRLHISRLFTNLITDFLAERAVSKQDLSGYPVQLALSGGFSCDPVVIIPHKHIFETVIALLQLCLQLLLSLWCQIAVFTIKLEIIRVFTG